MKTYTPENALERARNWKVPGQHYLNGTVDRVQKEDTGFSIYSSELGGTITVPEQQGVQPHVGDTLEMITVGKRSPSIGSKPTIAAVNGKIVLQPEKE